MKPSNPFLTFGWHPDKAERKYYYKDKHSESEGEEWERKQAKKEAEEAEEAAEAEE